MQTIPSNRISDQRAGFSRQRRAATTVEFALVVPIVFILFFAAVEFSRMAMIRHTIDNAVYEGARAAIIPGGTAADALAEARRVLATVGVNRPAIDVIPATIVRDTPRVTVRISVALDGNSYVPQQYFRGRSITRELTLRREGVR